MPRRSSYLPRRSLVWWQGVLFGATATAAAALARIGLNQASPSEAPYLPFFMAVLISAVWGGWLSGAVATVGSGLLSVFLVINARATAFTHVRGLALYVVLCAVLIIVVDTMQRALQREAELNEHLTIVTRELHHRMKNVIMLATSITHQTGRNAASVADYQDKVIDRLTALGRAQDMLIDAGGERVPLAALCDRILSPFDTAGHLAAPISGPEVTIEQSQATTLALLLNELATNATKYGALSEPKGRLALAWANAGEWTWINWVESDGPEVKPPSGSGFGSRLFLSALPSHVGKVEVAYDPTGLRCRIGLRRGVVEAGAGV